LDDTGRRAETLRSRYEAVERSILEMHERLDEALPLQALAHTAILSPFHFSRVFCAATGVPPCRFLAALRLEAAKRLLLTTDLTVTEVCLEVGYQSLGSFTRDFRQHVGFPPSRLRQLAEEVTTPMLGALLHRYVDGFGTNGQQYSVTGRIRSPADWCGPIFVGLFATPIPHDRPLGCTVLAASGPFGIGSVPDGKYYLLAVAFPWSDIPMACLLPDSRSLLVGMRTEPLLVHCGRAEEHVQIDLRPTQLTDPPILVALPFLLGEHVTEMDDAHARCGSPDLP
jgi:AraC-like DNA-binding protein